MRPPRSSTAGLLALILILGLDCAGAGVMLADPWMPRDPWGSRSFDLSVRRRSEVAAAVLPMANALAVVGIWGRRRPGRAGFLVAGRVAVVAGGVIASATTKAGSYQRVMYDRLPFDAAIGSALEALPATFRTGAVQILGLGTISGPSVLTQFAVAGLGRRFDRRYEIRRRP